MAGYWGLITLEQRRRATRDSAGRSKPNSPAELGKSGHRTFRGVGGTCHLSVHFIYRKLPLRTTGVSRQTAQGHGGESRPFCGLRHHLGKPALYVPCNNTSNTSLCISIMVLPSLLGFQVLRPSPTDQFFKMNFPGKKMMSITHELGAGSWVTVGQVFLTSCLWPRFS